MFGNFTAPPTCGRCGAVHYAHQPCSYVFANRAALSEVPSGFDATEDYEIFRWHSAQQWRAGLAEAARRAESRARLELALERL